MTPANNLHHLAGLIRSRSSELLTHWRRDVRVLKGAEHLDVPTLDDHIPAFINELIGALEHGRVESVAEAHAEGCPSAHGMQRLHDGFDIVEVVAEYNILRDALQSLAESHGLDLKGDAGRTVNRLLDRAIGVAVRTYATERALEIQQRREERLAFVVHDLRTPLSAMAVATEVLDETLPAQADNNEPGEMVKTLRRNIDRLQAIVTNVMQEEVNLVTNTTSRLERRDVDLWPFVERFIEDLRPLAEANETRLINEVPEDLVVFADATLLTQIVQNLLSNAIRFTPRGNVTVGGGVIDDGVECWVKDDGDGIPQNRLESVFEKLETDPDPEKSGTGLGLAIVKQSVEAHGGTIALQSRPERGSTFTFTLPRRESAR